MASNKITKINFHFGSNIGDQGLEVDVTGKNLVIFVGPGGSGKTKSLIDIMRFVDPNRDPRNNNPFVDGISMDFPNSSEEVINELKSKIDKSSNPKEKIQLVRSLGDRSNAPPQLSQEFSYSEIIAAVVGSGSATTRHPNNALFGTLGFSATGYINLNNRLSMTQMDDMEDRFYPQKLFSNQTAIEKINSYTLKRLEKYYSVKKWRRGPVPLPGKEEIGYIQRLSKIKIPMDPLNQESQFTTDEIKTFGILAPAELGQGMIGYVGIIAALHTFNDMANILIDEPDSFLHPPFQKYLGEDLVDIATNENKLFIVTTHSPNFILGALRQAEKVLILRMEYSKDTGQGIVREMNKDTILSLANTPILRTANALNALFHQGAIVSESDSDRMLYDEIHWRNEKYGYTKPPVDAMFVNGNSKSNVYLFISPLRQMGVPVAAILDFDTILYEKNLLVGNLRKFFINILCRVVGIEQKKEDGNNKKDVLSTWKSILNACGITTGEKDTLLKDLLTLSENLSSKYSRKIIKERGVNGLGVNDKEIAEKFLGKLNEIGIFVVPIGELESWLGYLGKVSKKNKKLWLQKMLNKLGTNPESGSYVKPEDRDVWKFLDQIVAWIRNKPAGMKYE